MALNKDELVAILGGMDESNLVKALSAVGVKIDQGGGDGLDYKDGVLQGDANDDTALASWNATKVVVPQTARGPLFDKSQTTEAPQVPGQSAQPLAGGPRPYDDQEGPGSLAPFAAATA